MINTFIDNSLISNDLENGSILEGNPLNIEEMALVDSSIKIIQENNLAATVDALKGREIAEVDTPKISRSVLSPIKEIEMVVSGSPALGRAYSPKISRDKDLRKLNQKSLCEEDLRKELEGFGIRTFPRPKKVPANWEASITKKSGGIIYKNPKNKNEFVRVMPGKPESPHPTQQHPYVIHIKNGLAIDEKGGKVNTDSVEAHIPLAVFDA